jgi:hypothetical protein
MAEDEDDELTEEDVEELVELLEELFGPGDAAGGPGMYGFRIDFTLAFTVFVR